MRPGILRLRRWSSPIAVLTANANDSFATIMNAEEGHVLRGLTYEVPDHCLGRLRQLGQLLSEHAGSGLRSIGFATAS